MYICIYTYSYVHILTLSAVFLSFCLVVSLQGNGTMDIYSFFSEMNETETLYGHWLLGVVGAGGNKPELAWDQYLEVTHALNLFEMCVSSFVHRARRGGAHPNNEEEEERFRGLACMLFGTKAMIHPWFPRARTTFLVFVGFVD